jgi:hypothetical protein
MPSGGSALQPDTCRFVFAAAVQHTGQFDLSDYVTSRSAALDIEAGVGEH